jgi:hypothetical protein
MTREAVLVIPGIRPAKQGEHLQVFLDGMRGAVEIADLSGPADAEIDGLKGKRVQCRFLQSGDEKEIDIYECFFADLVPDLATAQPLIRLRDGTRLIFFWFFSGIWKGFRRNSYLASSGLVSSVMLLLWYFAVLAVGLSAIGSLPVDPENRLLAEAATAVGRLGAVFGEWSVWIGVGTILSFLRIGRIANISHFLRLYLATEDVRNTIRLRVREPLLQILKRSEYSRLTVVAHSFGVLVAIDVMADFVQKSGPKVSVVSIAGPAGVLMYVSTWLKQELDRCQNNPAIASWADFSSHSDWMGGSVPFEQPVFPFHAVGVPDLGGWTKRFTGGTHQAYFNRREVMESVIAPPPRPTLVAATGK